MSDLERAARRVAVRVIGRDPRKMTLEELAAAGFPRQSPLDAIRAFYLKKHDGSLEAVRDDADTSNPLWPFRLGKDPFPKRILSPEVRQARSERGRALARETNARRAAARTTYA